MKTTRGIFVTKACSANCTKARIFFFWLGVHNSSCQQEQSLLIIFHWCPASTYQKTLWRMKVTQCFGHSSCGMGNLWNYRSSPCLSSKMVKILLCKLSKQAWTALCICSKCCVQTCKEQWRHRTTRRETGLYDIPVCRSAPARLLKSSSMNSPEPQPSLDRVARQNAPCFVCKNTCIGTLCAYWL